MCRSNGSLFYKKSLNMGPIFYQKILKRGSTFMTEPKIFGVFAKSQNFWKMGLFSIFQEKSLKMGTLSKVPLKMVGVLRLERHTPVQLKNEYLPGSTCFILGSQDLWSVKKSVHFKWTIVSRWSMTMSGSTITLPTVVELATGYQHFFSNSSCG